MPSGILPSPVPLITFEDNRTDSALDFLCHQGDTSKPRLALHHAFGWAVFMLFKRVNNVDVMVYPRFDHLVAIERIGRAGDGNYYNMRGVNIKHLVDPIDNLFIAAKNIRGISTTGTEDP